MTIALLAELKRDKTPRDVVAQALDYASWVQNLESNDLAEIFRRFAPGKDLPGEFLAKFGHEIDEDELNQTHQIIIVAAEIDESTERIVQYLNDKDMPINILFFQIFTDGAEQFISRTWLLDPTETQQAAASTGKQRNVEPWNGEFYCSFGDGESRSWEEAQEYDFISGGGGAWYSRTLKLLKPGDRVWVKIPGKGFVGVCRVIGYMQPAREFKIRINEEERPALEVLKNATYNREFVDDDQKCEYFVRVKWLDTRLSDLAVQEVGMFGNQNTVCKPTSQKWRLTVEWLKEKFPAYDQKGS